MEKFVKTVGASVIIIVIVFGLAILNGTILWMIFPHIHALFPSAESSGILPHDLRWWDSVCVAWIFLILIKGSPSSSSDKNDKK